MVANLDQTRLPHPPRPFGSFLSQAEAALNGGDASSAERIAKAVTALVRAEREVAEFLAAQQEQVPEDDDAIRAEIRSRIRRLVAAQDSGAPLEVVERLAAEGAQ